MRAPAGIVRARMLYVRDPEKNKQKNRSARDCPFLGPEEQQEP